MNWKLVFPFIDQYPPVSENDIAAFEQRNAIALPREYAEHLVRHRGSCPMMQNDRGTYAEAAFLVDWQGKAAASYGPKVGLSAMFGLFEGKEIESPYKGGCDLDDNIVWNRHLHPAGLLPIGSDAGNSMLLLGLVGSEWAGRLFFLSTFHIRDTHSFDHIGVVAPSFNAFVEALIPDGVDA